MARPIGEILKEIVDKLSNQMEKHKPDLGDDDFVRDYKAGQHWGLAQAIRIIEQTHTHE